MPLKDYIDSNGYLSPNGQCSGNGILYSCEYLMITLIRFEIQSAHEEASLWMGSYGVKLPLMRSPTSSDQESFDDYIGYVSLCATNAIQVLDYGNRNFWMFRNDPKAPWYKAWLGRSPAFVAHVRACAGHFPGIIGQFAWAWTIATAGKSQDSWMLSGVMCKGIRHYTWIMWWAVKRYQRNLDNSKYKGNLGLVFAEYFNDPNHPLVEAWTGIRFSV